MHLEHPLPLTFQSLLQALNLSLNPPSDQKQLDEARRKLSSTKSIDEQKDRINSRTHE